MRSPFFSRLQRFVAARLSPEGAAGLHLTLGVALMLAAAWLFGGIAEDVVSGARITQLDVALAHYLHQHANAALTAFMLLVTHWHGMIGTGVMALMLAAYFYWRRARYWLLTVVVVVPGGMALNVLLKYVFQRARPSFDAPLLTLTSYSFPSGHTLNAVMLYGLLGSWLVLRHRRAGTRALIVAGACAMVALVGLSRMVLGVHYLSDVLAATAEGCAWLAVCITAISTLRRRREARARNPFGSLQ
ncbi:MAG: phosphatase PAP2 family protein [Massilia sp.]|nr:phosphatase PAP2 family protein [Massilia sp.]